MIALLRGLKDLILTKITTTNTSKDTDTGSGVIIILSCLVLIFFQNILWSWLDPITITKQKSTKEVDKPSNRTDHPEEPSHLNTASRKIPIEKKIDKSANEKGRNYDNGTGVDKPLNDTNLSSDTSKLSYIGESQKENTGNDRESMLSGPEQKDSLTNAISNSNRINQSKNEEPSWRCVCEGSFLPPGLLKPFGGAEAILRAGMGQCYHKI